MKYTIYYGSDIIHANGYAEASLIDPVIIQEINKASALTFKITPKHYMFDSVKTYSENIIVKRDDQTIFIGIATSYTEDMYRTRSFKCESALTFLNNSVHRLKKYDNLTALQFMQYMLTVHNLEISNDTTYSQELLVGTFRDTSGKTLSCVTNYESTLECISKYLLGQIGGYLVERYSGNKTYIDYYSENYSGFHQANQPAQVGVNILDMSIEEYTEAFATRIMPLGAKLTEQPIEGVEARLDITSVNDNVPYVDTTDHAALQKYGYVVKTVIYDEVTDPNVLKEYGLQWLSKQDYGRKSVTAKVVDMSFVDSSFEVMNLLDKVLAKTKVHEFAEMMMVTRKEINITEPENDSVTLGFVEKSSNITAQVSEVKGEAGGSSLLIKSKTINGTTSRSGSLLISSDEKIKVLAAYVSGCMCIPYRSGNNTYIKVLEDDITTGLWTSGNKINFSYSLIAGKYIDGAGAEADAEGKSATNFIDCSLYKRLFINWNNASGDNCFYDSGKNKISSFNTNGSSILTMVDVPVNARYVRMSNATSAFTTSNIYAEAETSPVYVKNTSVSVTYYYMEVDV